MLVRSQVQNAGTIPSLSHAGLPPNSADGGLCPHYGTDFMGFFAVSLLCNVCVARPTFGHRRRKVVAGNVHSAATFYTPEDVAWEF